MAAVHCSLTLTCCLDMDNGQNLASYGTPDHHHSGRTHTGSERLQISL